MIPSCLRSNPESKWDAIAEALCFNESRGSALKNAIKMVVFSVARIVSYILKGEENYFKDLNYYLTNLLWTAIAFLPDF